MHTIDAIRCLKIDIAILACDGRATIVLAREAGPQAAARACVASGPVSG
jgi:hypothetical protein